MAEKAKKDSNLKLSRTAANKARNGEKFPYSLQGIPDFHRPKSLPQVFRDMHTIRVGENFQKVSGIYPVFQVVADIGPVLHTTLKHAEAVSAFKAASIPCELRKLTSLGFSVLDRKTA